MLDESIDSLVVSTSLQTAVHMANPIGPLIPADENFTHQVAETFACVGTTDPSWTEKVCAMAMANDGSLQIGFGLGKYTNRNIMDAYAAVSRGVEQLTVRASRRLSPEPGQTIVGPIHYEIVEPFKAIRFRLESNSSQPLAFGPWPDLGLDDDPWM